MRQMLLKAALLVVALGAFLALSAGQALASHVKCGDTITQDTRLDNDLLNCPGDGVVIGADNITLDLNDHLIDGTGFPTSGAGVDNNAGHDGVTITGGRIQEFAAGVQFTAADNGQITRLTVTRSLFTAYLQDSDGNLVSRNVGDAGITLIGDSDANLIERNTLLLPSSASGIEIIGVFPGIPERNGIERNTVAGGGEGIGVSGGADTAVERNDVSGAQRGIVVAAVRTRLLQNTVSNSEVGITLGGAIDTELVKNDVTGSTGDGINVGSPSTQTLLEQNTANRNGDDGIDVDSASATLAKNTANDNTDLGIEAVPGVTDGGGNKARGNGTAAQCLNVSCK
jgi:parallel beta-helix repeat protein